MRTFLDILAILGGIATIWSFWDRFTAYRSRKKSKTVTSGRPRTKLRAKARPSPVQEMVWAAILCGISGVFAGVISVKYSWEGASVLFWVGIIIFAIAASRGIGVVELAGGFMSSWAFVGIILVGPLEAIGGAPLAESLMGTVFIIIGGLLGAAFGLWQVNDSVYRFVHYREY